MAGAALAASAVAERSVGRSKFMALGAMGLNKIERTDTAPPQDVLLMGDGLQMVPTNTMSYAAKMVRLQSLWKGGTEMQFPCHAVSRDHSPVYLHMAITVLTQACCPKPARSEIGPAWTSGTIPVDLQPEAVRRAFRAVCGSMIAQASVVLAAEAITATLKAVLASVDRACRLNTHSFLLQGTSQGAGRSNVAAPLFYREG